MRSFPCVNFTCAHSGSVRNSMIESRDIISHLLTRNRAADILGARTPGKPLFLPPLSPNCVISGPPRPRDVVVYHLSGLKIRNRVESTSNPERMQGGGRRGRARSPQRRKSLYGRAEKVYLVRQR